MATQHRHPFERIQSGYQSNETRPLRGYLAALGGYAEAVGLLAGTAVLRRKQLTSRFTLGDVVRHRTSLSGP